MTPKLSAEELAGYAPGPLQTVERAPSVMEKAQMIAHILDHHARINDRSVRYAIEKIVIDIARDVPHFTVPHPSPQAEE